MRRSVSKILIASMEHGINRLFQGLFVVLISSILTFTAEVSFAVPDGDFTSKGSSDISDALRCLKIVVGLIQSTDLDIAHGDVAPLDPVTHKPKGDGKLDIGDALGILRHVVNIDTWSTINTLPVTGKITFNGLGLQGAKVTLTGAGSSSTATTDSIGNFSFSGAQYSSYTITPLLTGYLFTPVSKSIQLNGSTASMQDFTATSVGTTTATTIIVPFKGMFISGRVSLTDANDKEVPLLNGTGTIDANGMANIVYAKDVTYPLIVSVTGVYVNETTGDTSETTVPLHGLIPVKESIDQASGIPVTAITEIAVARLLKQTSAGPNRDPSAAVDALTVAAKDVLGQYYSQAMMPPVFDATGKTTNQNTLQLAALAVIANNLGVGGDLSAKINSLAQKLASGESVSTVIPQSEFDSAIKAVNGGTFSMLPPGAPAQSIPAHIIPASALGVAPTLYNGYTALSKAGIMTALWKASGDMYLWGGSPSVTYAGDYFDIPTLSSLHFTAIANGELDYGKLWKLYGLKDDNTLWSWGSGEPTYVGAGYAAISADASHLVALKTDGSLPGMIGSGYKAISSGSDYSVALKTDGSLWAWGGNNYGQLGDGTFTNRNVPVMIGVGYASLTAGGFTTFAIKTDGSLWAWGWNFRGVIGDGTGTNRNVPTMIGTEFTTISTNGTTALALKSDGSLWGWGDNRKGNIGDGTKTDSSVPKMINSFGYTAISVGDFSLAIKKGGNLWAWGTQPSYLPNFANISLKPTEAATGRTVDNVEVDALEDYPTYMTTFTCSYGPNTVSVVNGPCGNASFEYQYASTCTSASLGWATENYFRCAMENSTGNPKVNYTYQYNIAARDNLAARVPGAPCVFIASPGHYNALGSCIPGAPPTATLDGLSGSSSGLTAAQITAAKACASAPYDNPQSAPYDPQFDSNCQLAQFDACLHKATGQTTYDQEGHNACSVVSGLISATGSSARCGYCPFPY